MSLAERGDETLWAGTANVHHSHRTIRGVPLSVFHHVWLECAGTASVRSRCEEARPISARSTPPFARYAARTRPAVEGPYPGRSECSHPQARGGTCATVRRRFVYG